jgi:uncharacterized membrane protein YhiD involved in acid resistance
MRRLTMAALAAAAALGVTAVAPNAATAASASAPSMIIEAVVHTVQYYGPRHHYDGHRARHRHWREHRRAREEARIADAARREAHRIEQERAARRAWRHAGRDHYGYYRGH